VSDNIRLAVWGAGGHGREVACVVIASGASLDGFIDDGQPDLQILARFGSTHLGGSNVLRDIDDGVKVVIGVGSGTARAQIDTSIPGSMVADPVVDPMASLGVDVRLREGAVVFAQSTVTTNVRIGRHTHIGRGAAIGHDCRLDDFVTVMPMASVSGNVTVGRGATIGAGAVVRQGHIIGKGAYVGAGAVVVKDIPDGETVVGNPAQPIRR